MLFVRLPKSQPLSRSLKVVTALSAALMPSVAGASPWQVDPNVQLPDSGYVSQKVELVDVNNDGFVDIVFANSSGTDTGSIANAQPNQLLINMGGTAFTEQGSVFEDPDNAYVIKAGDLDNDGDADLVVGVNYQGQSYVLINEGGGDFTRQDISFSANKSIGDLELGDVDGDGNLDIVATDWGNSQPFGDPVDQGQPLQLWLGNGDGTFANGNPQLPMGMETFAAYSFDIELVDVDNDYALDVLVSSRGVGFGFGLQNDGNGNFSKLTIPALEANIAKQVNVSFTPSDFNGDGFIDLITLQDGVGQGGNCIEVMGVQYCAKRNALLLNNGMGNYPSDPGTFWPIANNPAKLDFDAATLDFNNDGRPDFVATGLRLAQNDKNSRLFLNKNNMGVEPASVPLDAAFPIVPELAQSFGLMFADFNHDRREDVAIAQRDAGLPNFVLFGRDDPTDGVAFDTSKPRIYDDGFANKLGTLLYFGKEASINARVDDYKTPSHWHDHKFDTNLADYNLTGEGAALTAHNRRLPYMEFALSLDNPDDLLALADGDPQKFISPSIWFGEALWRVKFNVPYNGNKEDTLTWQYCAIDAADNKICVGPFSVKLEVDPADCGDGEVQEWETCDDDSETCIKCEQTCGNGTCDDNETPENCPEDCGEGPCDHDGACEPPEDANNCPDDCDYDGVCGDGTCQSPPENEQNCPDDCGPCDNDGACEPPENAQNCPNDCDYDGYCGDDFCTSPPETEENCPDDCLPEPTDGGECGNGVCDDNETPTSCPEDCAVCGDDICSAGEEQTCPEDCDGASASDGQCPDTAGGVDGQCQLDDDGCGCVAEPDSTRGLWASLLLFGVFGVRRFRKRA
ncbi:FG-GAP-like repeat-containing protein [Nannocystis radixulma]|uniref:FG-GAP-like repeat-containing protein n=1 Tax=Nannocystis radixulma TaxID=2995305 RepID=A0ABT5B9W7_9BACT|nr:FG-GAP-like repeat-containing protein [Nannocystis radixulma]MDC0670933.1 FG-GAP-like repeat-containing protein [Nannocystis radixulma]